MKTRCEMSMRKKKKKDFPSLFLNKVLSTVKESVFSIYYFTFIIIYSFRFHILKN